MNTVKSETKNTAQSAPKIPIKRPPFVIGKTSPYPTVVIVIRTHHIAFGISFIFSSTSLSKIWKLVLNNNIESNMQKATTYSGHFFNKTFRPKMKSHFTPKI